MNTEDYIELFRSLIEQECLQHVNVVFVENIFDWCEKHGIPESDKERPFKLIVKDGEGCKMLLRQNITDGVIDERINAMSIRNQLRSLAINWAERLDSYEKKLAYLFLSEYAFSLPEINDDELLADEWTFQEMEKLGYFRK
jgi:hypothetical protein